MTAKNGDSLLRATMRANAAFSTVSGLILAAGSYAIGPRIGVEPSWIVLIVGLGLLPFAFELITNSRKQIVDLGRVRQAVAGDFAWVIASVVIMFVDPTGLTTTGYIAISGVAVVVATFALLQWNGSRRARIAYRDSETESRLATS